MGHGGKREGSGRKPGSPNLNVGKTREIIERAAGEGVSPLEVMLDNMRFYHSEASKLVDKLIAGGVLKEKLVAEGDDEQPHSSVIEAIGQVLGLRKLAGEEAARAAPYCLCG